MKPLHKGFAALVMVVFAVPNFYFVLRGGEDFPFTCGPMYAHYLGWDTPLYNFKFIGEYEGTETVLPSRLGNLSEAYTMRYFFSKVYGSCEEWSPFGDHPNDSRAQFEERLSRYFKQYLYQLRVTNQANTRNLKRLRLEVWRYNKEDRVDEKHIVGYYSAADETFKHQWTYR
jgi:hypothetical protein